MDNNNAETPEDEREISLNETSLKRPLDVVDVIGGHGPWQFRQWIVFFAASLCNSMVAFSALFLPSQTFCPPENSTGFQADAASSLGMNNSVPMPEMRSFLKNNDSFHSENLGNICNSTNCKANINESYSDISSSKLFGDAECWNSQVEVFAKCCYMIACVLSGLLVYLSTDRFGRRPAAFSSSVILIASSLATSWADTASIFLILRFVTSFCVVNIYFISAFSLMEYVHEDFKLLYFLTGHLGWGMAHFLLPAVAWLAADWKSFNIILSIIGMLLSFFVWWSPESPSSFPNGGEHTRTRKVLKYAAFTNGYSTTDVDLLSHNYHLCQESKHELGTLASTKSKLLFILYSSVLFLMSFTTVFLYFAAKWHSEWFKVDDSRISFSFLGTTEVASTIILIFLTCFVAIKYLWAIVSALSSILLIIIFSRTDGGSTKSSALLYTGIVFLAAAAWTLVVTKSFCHKISGVTTKFNLLVTGVAAFAGALAASAIVLKADNHDLLITMGVPHLIFAITTIFLPENFFGTVA